MRLLLLFVSLLICFTLYSPETCFAQDDPPVDNSEYNPDDFPVEEDPNAKPYDPSLDFPDEDPVPSGGDDTTTDPIPDSDFGNTQPADDFNTPTPNDAPMDDPPAPADDFGNTQPDDFNTPTPNDVPMDDPPAPADDFGNTQPDDFNTPTPNDVPMDDPPAPTDDFGNNNDDFNAPTPNDVPMDDPPAPADDFGNNNDDFNANPPTDEVQPAENQTFGDGQPALEGSDTKTKTSSNTESYRDDKPDKNKGGGKKESYRDEDTANAGGGGGGAGNVEIPRDGIYDRITAVEKQPLKYDHLREADIFWEKRVWRVIDTRQKMNIAFSNPKEPLIDVLLGAIHEKDSKVRIFLEDYFETPIDTTELSGQLGSVDTIMVVDPDTYEETQEIVRNDFDWTSVKKFRLKEDWVFDEESGRMIVRVLGIAPIRDIFDENGNYRGQNAMFWAYYPDLRETLTRHEVTKATNNAQRLSWDDMLHMRYFQSYIMKESNEYDRRIKDYSSGTDALMEAERVKQELFQKEHNLWSY